MRLGVPRKLLVARTGFEPVISALRGRRPEPLDERAKSETSAHGWDGGSRTPIDGTRIRCPAIRRHPKVMCVMPQREEILYGNDSVYASPNLRNFNLWTNCERGVRFRATLPQLPGAPPAKSHVRRRSTQTPQTPDNQPLHARSPLGKANRARPSTHRK